MAAKLTPAGAIGKWIVVPVALLLIGYFLLGPKVGRLGIPALNRLQTVGEPPNADPQPQQATGATQHALGPEVEITVHKTHAKSGEVATHAASAHHRRHKVAAKQESQPASTVSKPPVGGPPTQDQGGSAGSTTAGDT